MKNILLSLCIIPQVLFAYYGEDTRIDYRELKDKKLKKIASAMAYQVEKTELRGWTFNRYWKMVSRSFSDRGICSDDKFAKQSSMRANCTGILIGEDTLLTAGNCITEHYCWNDLYYWAFNYHLETKANTVEKLHRKNFYKCDKVIKRVFDPSSGISFAVLKLKKKVKGITPVKLSKSSIAKDKNFIIMGHEKGLPLKISQGSISYDENEDAFITNSDIAGSNKGSAVLNSKTLELEGILIYGNTGYEQSPDSSCIRPSVYKEEEASELVLKSHLILPYIE